MQKNCIIDVYLWYKYSSVSSVKMITLNISNQLELRLIFGSFIKFRNWKFFSFYLLVLENVSWFSSFSPSYGMVVTATLQSISTLELKLDFLTVNFVNLGLLVLEKIEQVIK